MISELNQTPKSLRIHIGVFGDTNAGKSTFINAVTGQNIALTSPVAGTTTDPVFKPMELHPLGPVVFIDTAGLDDKTELGEIRINKTIEQIEICDMAILVVNNRSLPESQKEYISIFEKKKIPYFLVVNIMDNESIKSDFSGLSANVVYADLHDKNSIKSVKEKIIKILEKKEDEPVLTADLVKKGDIVLLITPQDIQAPKGRLILPEVQVMRDLLDNGCIPIAVTADNIENVLKSLKNPPNLVITDSQIFKTVNEIIPKDIPLTSFSLLMAKIKGNISGFINGAEAIDNLQDGDKVLIMESCTHHAMDDDIARIKIPNLLRKYTGKQIEIDNVSGQNPDVDISKYKLVIHCGGCMINRKAMMSKQKKSEEINVPMTNFGVAIAFMNGMLNRICY